MKKTMLMVSLFVLSMTLYACTEDSETPITDDVSMPAVDGQSFLEDGIGKAELFACRDGDTADFEADGEIFRVRFLALDTPESGHIYEPWGLPASNKACSIMENADEIVLEYDEGAGGRRGNYGRYLAFIWVDGRNLNLELIERGYSYAQGFGSFAYASELISAENAAREASLGLHGTENDPTYPYGVSSVDQNIDAIIDGGEDNYLHRFNVEGIVKANIDGHSYIEDPESGRGIFVFAHYDTLDNRMHAGNHVRIEDVQYYQDGKPYQSHFLTDFDPSNVSVIEEDVDLTYETMPLHDISSEDLGKVRTFENLTITDFDSDEMTLYATDDHGESIAVHQLGVDYMDDGLFSRSSRINEWDSVTERTLAVGDTFSGTFAISNRRAHGTTLIMLGDEHFTLHD